MEMAHTDGVKQNDVFTIRVGLDQLMFDAEDAVTVCNIYGYCLRLRKSDKFVLATLGEYNGQVLARLLINAPKHKQVDHINGNPLDNRKHNLRLCTQSQNNMNREVKNSPYPKGVSIHKKSGKFRSRIQYEGIQLHLGLFDNVEQAEAAYLRMATILFREFAYHASRKNT